jgi:tetratricopeptide (TPR) repeat protein
LLPILQFPRLAASLLIVGFALDSYALTIGRPQGAVWIGKPMDVVIPLSLDGADAGGSLCLQADVLQGDSPMPDRRVTVSFEQGAGGARMRVRSSVPIEEPVVTLNVRAGCDLKSTRNYVLLADVQVDAALPAVAAPSMRQFPEAAPLPRPVARAAPRSTAGDGGVSGQEGASPPSAPRRSNPPPPRPPAAAEDVPPRPRRSPAAEAGAAARRTAAAVPAPATRVTPPSSPPAASEAAPREAGAGRPRLQVEALEPAPARAGNLRATPELTLPDAPDPVRRAAAAALWNALDPAAEEAQREAKRAKDTDAALAALREQAAQNQRTLLEMRSELAQARESRYANPLVYALAALLLLALIGMFMLWRLARRASAPAWWGEALPGEGDPRRPRPHGGLLDDEMDLDSKPPRSRRSVGPRTFAPTPFAPLEPADDDLDTGPHAPLPHPAQLAEGTPARLVNTEELFDVQQQSDFFLSLGQHDQAIAVLREHIAANPGTSALAYLDLLRIFHSLEREDDYTRLAEDFERVFNADVPSFAHFTDTGKGLEHYRGALARIEALWPAPGTLALIEELVFRKPGHSDDGAFDLAAYQELLLLYSVAKEVIDPASAPPAAYEPHAFADTLVGEGPPTVTAPADTELAPAAIEGGPVLPPSLYGSIDQGLQHETVLDPGAQLSPVAPAPTDRPAVLPDLEMDLGAFDKTAYETLLTPIEPVKAPTPSNDPHVIDFELFDPSTEAEIAPRPIKR